VTATGHIPLLRLLYWTGRNTILRGAHAHWLFSQATATSPGKEHIHISPIRTHDHLARMPRFFVTRHWRYARIMYAFFVVEFLLTVAVLTLYGIADPNTYRTRLWQNGADAGFNSDPSIVLYSYANYKPIKTPLVWSQ
jgi:hypothetical protein